MKRFYSDAEEVHPGSDHCDASGGNPTSLELFQCPLWEWRAIPVLDFFVGEFRSIPRDAFLHQFFKSFPLLLWNSSAKSFEESLLTLRQRELWRAAAIRPARKDTHLKIIARQSSIDLCCERKFSTATIVRWFGLYLSLHRWGGLIVAKKLENVSCQ